MVAAVGIEEIVRNHRVRAWTVQTEPCLVKRQQCPFQIVDDLGSIRVMKQCCDGWHDRAKFEKHESRISSSRKGETQ